MLQNGLHFFLKQSCLNETMRISIFSYYIFVWQYVSVQLNNFIMLVKTKRKKKEKKKKKSLWYVKIINWQQWGLKKHKKQYKGTGIEK